MEKRSTGGLKIYNTLKRVKEDFIPLREGTAGIYVCGVTVYDECHLGHARAYVSFDVLRRYLEYSGYRVVHVQNFTDIDDKIIARAREFRAELSGQGRDVSLKEAADSITARYTRDYFEQMEKLGVKKAHHYPRATEHVEEMVALISELVEKKYAYDAGGDVYFSIEKFPGYGKLSGRDISGMRAGARVEPEAGKRNPLDFALWKSAGEDEPSWDSPFGRGRPGWHIECSAMSRKYLGETFDIHGGGADLVFPHHENEIAQSEALSGKPFARYWMHNGYLTVNGEKMSKSLGNFTTLRSVLEDFPPEAVRFFFLSSHYRSPLDFSAEALELARTGYERLAECDRKISSQDCSSGGEPRLTPAARGFLEDFNAGMSDDLNTPSALAAVFNAARFINSAAGSRGGREELAAAAGAYSLMREVLGIPVGKPAAGELRREDVPGTGGLDEARLEALLAQRGEPSEEDIRNLLSQREICRKLQLWEQADRIRDKLSESISIRDTKDGVTWERKR